MQQQNTADLAFGSALTEQEMAGVVGGTIEYWYAAGYAIGWVAGRIVRFFS